jgi:hypothetical protein
LGTTRVMPNGQRTSVPNPFVVRQLGLRCV